MINEIFFSRLTIPLDFTYKLISSEDKVKIAIRHMIKESSKDVKYHGDVIKLCRELSKKGFTIGYIKDGEEIYETIHLSDQTIKRIYYEIKKM